MGPEQPSPLGGGAQPVTAAAYHRRVAHRPDPLRIYAARRAGRVSRLVSEARMTEDAAERWMAAWEAEARDRHLDARTPAWWDPAFDWIIGQRGAPRTIFDSLPTTT